MVLTAFNDKQMSRYWRALSERDWRFDGIVFYAVQTTGIYCIASCPARKPKRRNVVFYSTLKEAEGNGFRACKRCRPDLKGKKLSP